MPQKRAWILVSVVALAACHQMRLTSTKVALNPNVDVRFIHRVAVPYSLERTDPGSVERNIVPALSTEQGLLFLGYEVIDRGDLDSVLKEHELSLTGIATPEEAAKIGRILGIQGLVIPSVAPGDQPNVKLIDIATGRIIWNANGPLVFYRLAEVLKSKGWDRFPSRELPPVQRGDVRLAFAESPKARETIHRIGVVPFHVGHGVSWAQGSSLAGAALARLDGGLQADKIAGDLLAAGFDVIERTHLSRVMEELKLDTSGLLLQKNAQKIGELLNIQALVTGVAYNNVSNPTVAVKFIHLESGKVLSIYKGKRSKFSQAAKTIRAVLAAPHTAVSERPTNDR